MAQGEIFARFGVRGGQTRLLEHRQKAPLKIARTFPDPTRSGAMEICVMDASPGLLAGDSHHYEWILEAGAQVRVTAQGATRVHPARAEPETTLPGELSQNISSQNISARVATSARLELWPESIIPFRGAALVSRTEIYLEDGAGGSFFECLSAGRIARGEKFEFEQVSLQTQVFDSQGPLFCARNRFVPAELNPNARLSFGNWSQWATLITLGDSTLGGSAPTARAPTTRAQNAQEILKRRGLYGAASQLGRGGVAVSLLCSRAYDARCAALEIEAVWKSAVSRETADADEIF